MAEKDRKATRHFRMDMTAEEYQLFEDKVNYCGTTKAGFVRRMLHKGIIVKLDTEFIKSLLYEMNHIGNNVNQIAYHVNTTHSFSEVEFDMLRVEYENLFALVEEKILGL